MKSFGTVAIDISTGHAVDSHFRKERVDPWSARTVATFVDALVNHKEALYPLPTQQAETAGADDKNVPHVFALGRRKEFGLLNPVRGHYADQFIVTESEVHLQFSHFERWLQGEPENVRRLRNWLDMHFGVDRISEGHAATVPEHYVDQFWPNLPTGPLSQLTGVAPRRLSYAFDVVLRGLQYQAVVGSESPYFGHPIRDLLLPGSPSTIFQHRCSWSWGRYIVNLMAEQETFWSPTFLMETIQDLKSRCVDRATWYELADLSDSEQIQQIEAVATESDLPAKIKDDLLVKLDRNAKALGIAGGALTALLLGGEPEIRFFATILISTGPYAISDRLKSHLRPQGVAAGMIRLLKGELHWPGLFS